MFESQALVFEKSNDEILPGMNNCPIVTFWIISIPQLFESQA